MAQPNVEFLFLYPEFKSQSRQLESRATNISTKSVTGLFHVPVHVVFSNANGPVNYGPRDSYPVQVIRIIKNMLDRLNIVATGSACAYLRVKMWIGDQKIKI